MSIETYFLLLFIWIGIAVLVFLVNLKIVAPYGRHTTTTWGPLIPSRVGWIVMETPAAVMTPLLTLTGPNGSDLFPRLLVGLWLVHYVHRTYIFPFRMRESGKKMPLSIALMAFFFNMVNGSFVGLWLGHFGEYSNSWLMSIPFIVGIVVFLAGMGINLWADTRLLNLRKPGETGYKIPFRGLFEYISCPNHFGEIIEWTGFAIMTWSWAGASFAIWTAANLIPRALAHHRWYREKFSDYPPGRKAVIPGLF